MKLFGINISSLISPETNYIVTDFEFVNSLADDFPAFASLDANHRVLRKLILIKTPKFNFNFYPNYKYTIKVKNADNTLASLKGSEKIIVGLRANKSLIGNKKGITTKLYFLGIKNDEPYRLLILNDIPIIATNKEDLMNQLKSFLKETYNIKISKIPTVIDGVRYREKVDAKIVDVDYYLIIIP
ncbi:MAG: hypothetical protein QXR34_09040 [Saccharolobus sp.]